jgi:GntR family transcriptional regulator/MocR family aminotransferase
MRRAGIAALEYGERRGYSPLRRTIAHILASQGLQASHESILITAGSQQALALVSQLLLTSGDVVLVESPTYGGALGLFRALGLKVVGIPTDERGMQVEKLEDLLQQHHPKLIYSIPNFHNPTGVCLNSHRRRQLIALADRYNVPILEDDFVGDLRYEGRAQPALKALDPGGMVIYVSTFSKMLMPGLRVGFLVAEGPVYESLVSYKCVNDLATSNLIQRALESYVTVGRYQAHLRRSCRIYRKRRDVMLRAINRYLPAGVHVVPPQGGLFVWLCLPEHLSAERLLPVAGKAGVTFAPGSMFFPKGCDGEGYVRLNFAAQPPEAIEEGIRRLGKAMKQHVTGPGGPARQAEANR